MENINKRTEKSVLIYDYTNKVEEKVNELFGAYSNVDRDKVLFLLYLINKNTKANQGYQLHDINHKNFFGFKGNKGCITIQIIKDILISNNIIMQVGTASIGAKSNKYSISNVYGWALNKGEIKIGYDNYSSLPNTFLKKYVADTFVVKALKDTKYNKDYVHQAVEMPEEVEDNLNDLKMKFEFQNEEINIVKEENRLMKIRLEQLEKVIAGLNTGLKIEQVEETQDSLQDSNVIEQEVIKVEESQPVFEEEVMNKTLLIDDLEDENFNKLVEEWDEQEAIKEAEEEKNIFDLNKYKNNLPVDLTENVTNVIYRFTRSHQAVDKVIKLMNEGKVIEKSDLMTFGVSGAIVNQMYTAFQAVI